jgi:hypothetical protein
LKFQGSADLINFNIAMGGVRVYYIYKIEYLFQRRCGRKGPIGKAHSLNKEMGLEAPHFADAVDA